MQLVREANVYMQTKKGKKTPQVGVNQNCREEHHSPDSLVQRLAGRYRPFYLLY